MQEVFTRIYETQLWGSNQNDHYKGSSGGGSEMQYNIDTYVPFMKKFIKEHNIKSVVDLGCGDFVCGRFIYEDLNVTYQGYDVYQKVIDYHNSSGYSPAKYSFECLDVYNEKEFIVDADLCILKDILQHWTITEIYTFLDYVTTHKKFKYIVMCNCSGQQRDDPEDSDNRSTALSIDYYPLKKYNPVKLYKYNTKEVSVIYDWDLIEQI
jgi:hypothetical protein